MLSFAAIIKSPSFSRSSSSTTITKLPALKSSMASSIVFNLLFPYLFLFILIDFIYSAISSFQWIIRSMYPYSSGYRMPKYGNKRTNRQALSLHHIQPIITERDAHGHEQLIPDNYSNAVNNGIEPCVGHLVYQSFQPFIEIPPPHRVGGSFIHNLK